MKTNRLLCGIGINDSSIAISAEYLVGGVRKSSKNPIYQAWSHMLTRCYSEKLHAERPTYVGCTVAPEWHRFSVFRDWMIAQDWRGRDLDKDILIPGNKVYSPDTCAFITRQLNLFLSTKPAQRGEFPVGAYWEKQKKKFVAQCGNPFTGKREHLGYFMSAEEAHEAWRVRKHQWACRFADMQTDPRVASALRARFAPGFLEQSEAA